jgi:hypothetical protein
LEIVPDKGLFWILVFYHGYLLARVIGYALDGFDCSKIPRRGLMCIMGILAVAMAMLDKRIELMVTTTSFFVIAIVSYFLVKTGKMNGDNDNFDRSDLDDQWFDTVNDIIYRVKFSFPLNIENYKCDRSRGYITALGRIINNKHTNSYGALITAADGKEYLCPLWQIKPLEILVDKNDIDMAVTIARKDGIVEIVCLSWKNGDKVDGSIYELAISGI